ncbi:MAG TPA: hypothetical protein VFD01_01965 [Candidatus Dormibacteraeota bacterium]|nr:hypothetical protein [Candidatus Dormibacteraeota bacterium]
MLERLDRRRFPTVMFERPLDIRVTARDSRRLRVPWLQRRILRMSPPQRPAARAFRLPPTLTVDRAPWVLARWRRLALEPG